MNKKVIVDLLKKILDELTKEDMGAIQREWHPAFVEEPKKFFMLQHKKVEKEIKLIDKNVKRYNDIVDTPRFKDKNRNIYYLMIDSKEFKVWVSYLNKKIIIYIDEDCSIGNLRDYLDICERHYFHKGYGIEYSHDKKYRFIKL